MIGSSDSTTNPFIRAFVALELPEDARATCAETMARARNQLGAEARLVRWVDPEGIHLTMKFLGSVRGERIGEIVDSLARDLADSVTAELAIGSLRMFPDPRAPRVIWLTLQGDLAGLRASQERVEVALTPLGFPREKRPFQPHLTLGRVREGTTMEQLTQIGHLASVWPAATGQPFHVTSISLMQSHLSPGGARYTRIAAFPLKKGTWERFTAETQGTRRGHGEH